jgi:CRISPR-associated exonuclease Cas4
MDMSAPMPQERELPETPPTTMRVSDLKQWEYCPRVPYFERHLPRIRPGTYKMQAGKEIGEAEEGREARRSLRAYGLHEGERSFAVRLMSAELGIHGIADMVIRTADEAIPVDYKLSKKVERNMKLQLCAYGLLLADTWSCPSRRGFIYLIPERRAVEVVFDARLRATVTAALAALKRIAESEAMPGPVSQIAKCVDCEFRRFCNDVF